MGRMMNENDSEQTLLAKLLENSSEPRELFRAPPTRSRSSGYGHRHGAGEADEGNLAAPPDKGEIVMRSEPRAIVRHERHPVLERLVPRHRDAGIVIARDDSHPGGIAQAF